MIPVKAVFVPDYRGAVLVVAYVIEYGRDKRFHRIYRG